MAMKSLEDLERAFDRGLNAWEREIVTKQAQKMGQKLVKSVRSKTPVITGNLRRRWTSEVNAGKGIEEYKSRYLKDDLDEMVKELNAKMKG